MPQQEIEGLAFHWTSGAAPRTARVAAVVDEI